MSGVIDRFEVTYSYTIKSCLEIGRPLTDNITDNTIPYMLENLNEDSIYTITVRAINIAGSANATVIGETRTSGESHQLHELTVKLMFMANSSSQWHSKVYEFQ